MFIYSVSDDKKSLLYHIERMKVIHILMLVCVVFMAIQITKDIMPPPPPPPILPPPTPTPPTYYYPEPEPLPVNAEEEIVWMNGRPVHTPIQIPDDNMQQQQPYGEQTPPSKEAAEVLAQTLGKKQLDAFPIFGTTQANTPQEEEEEKEPQETESESESEDIKMVSSIQVEDDYYK